MLGRYPISFTHRTSARAKRTRIVVMASGEVVLTTPAGVSLLAGERFVLRHARWVMRQKRTLLRRREYLEHRERAREFLSVRVPFFASVLGVSFSRIFVRDQKTRWGSCSRLGNLNFNYRIVFLPPHLQDYLIVHELAHRVEMNHSARFWDVVRFVVGDPVVLRRELLGKGQLQDLQIRPKWYDAL